MNIELNNIYHGNCLEIMPDIPDKSIDMVLCDLPYGITDYEWDKIISMDVLWRIYNRIIKDNGAIVLTATMKFAVDLINSNRKYFRYDLIWEKTLKVGFANAKRMPLRKHELILVFYKHLPTYNPQGLIKLDKPIHDKKHGGLKKSVYKDDTLQNAYTREYTNYPSSILPFANGNNHNVHPTQKPVELFEYLIKTYTNQGDTVLDNCIGSGTTAIACINTGRNYIGIEADKGYFDVACARVEDNRRLLLTV